MYRRFLVWFIFCLAAAAPLFGQFNGDESSPGDTAVAEQYARWGRDMIGGGRWLEAEIGLERAGDFSDVSSDISYLLALTRSHLGRPRGAVLESVRRSIETGRWFLYSEEHARLLEAKTLITLRAFPEALSALAMIRDSADAAELRLLALKGLADFPRFRSAAAAAMEAYPRDPRPVRILFEYAGEILPQGPDRDLVNTALRRMPVLLVSDPGLAYLAVPFIRDTEESSRLVASYRARGNPVPASIPAALNLGLINEETAIDELFSFRDNTYSAQKLQEPVLLRSLVSEIWDLLRSEQSRNAFMRNLLAFTGVIIDDGDKDGFPESHTRYIQGTLVYYWYDADQDGLPELEIFFSGGVPVRAVTVILPEQAAPQELPDNRVAGFAYPVRDEERTRVTLFWEQYPAVLRAELDRTGYIPPPFEFQYAPVQFTPLLRNGGAGDFLYPQRDRLIPRISRRSLISFASAIEQPSAEIPGAVERIEMVRGVPQHAAETLGGKLVSETEFLLGQPVLQRIDLDLDGRLETVRRFRHIPGVAPGDNPLEYSRIIDSSESDWNGDGSYEYGEQYLPGGRIERSWDTNGDGVRDQREIRTEE
ncbi:hypothetical protein [Breznakiella homolactica]|uniref:GWxTD domain-containing protein n=1 Tax=Breznakiella homolactica TaxID=2798577 RepID=A0A7T7XRH4_9SPIR|nr:hypothetical protein [Breznakiella homolactica]QQO11146.1 hypothetical protein JFL75_09605 [Breznakiella homolactica]